MLQTYEGTLNNGQITWNHPNDIPRKAKVLITILEEEKEVEKKTKPSLQFRGALKHLSQEQKDQNNQELQNLRDEWERAI
ncbi:hypothetical protein LV89_02477 [Arcicella aurantiaca]|uniref:Uncharacterized protein n=1 Tax=Arcicella aurantiaca TaxID=591202 RepID=A0A316E8A6_9BACT|nr:hypothetical protein [Arcicella aurantiaca]PWK26306.1 hypothetical protein LV89_02477 [Arcicella aurantiaca]